MAIVFSDIHGNTKKLHKALNYKPEELHIFAGDAVDSFRESGESQERCLKTLVESKCILIYGNHELSYHPEMASGCSGWHKYGQEHFPQYLDDSRWKAAYAVDDYLITHAGLAAIHCGKSRTAKTTAAILNKKFKDRNRDLLTVGLSRGGSCAGGSIFWYDFRYDYAGLTSKFNQVFGHCALQDPYEALTNNNKHHVCINSDDGSDVCWVFDTTKKKVVVLN